MQSATPSKPRIVLLVGLPGAGKSTWLRQHGLAALSTDQLRSWLTGDEGEQSANAQVFQALRFLLRLRLDLRQAVTYIDATNLTRQERRVFVRIGRERSAAVEALWFDVPYEVCLRRNLTRARVVPEEAMQRLRDRFVPPTLEEGLDAVQVIQNP